MEIVSRLQDVELVLCDMSGLNPNVFFELGIRTALNKPVCVVRDETTDRTPFDMSPINNHTYSSDVSPWILPGEIEKMAAHIKQSATVTDNALWKYFGLRIAVASADSPPGANDQLSLLRIELEALRRDLLRDRPTRVRLMPPLWENKSDSAENVADKLLESMVCKEMRIAGLSDSSIRIDPTTKIVSCSIHLPADLQAKIESIVNAMNFKFEWEPL